MAQDTGRSSTSYIHPTHIAINFVQASHLHSRRIDIVKISFTTCYLEVHEYEQAYSWCRTFDVHHMLSKSSFEQRTLVVQEPEECLHLLSFLH